MQRDGPISIGGLKDGVETGIDDNQQTDCEGPVNITAFLSRNEQEGEQVIIPAGSCLVAAAE